MDWKDLWHDIADIMTDMTKKVDEKKENLKDIDIETIKGVASDLHQRVSFGHQEISREEYIQALTPIFNEVKAAARKLDPEIPVDVKVYIKYNEDNLLDKHYKKFQGDVMALRPNAMVVSEGFFNLPVRMQKAVLGIGFGKIVYFLNTKIFKDEFISDEFCFNLGYGEELCEYLDSLKGKQKDINARIGKLQELGSDYRKKKTDIKEEPPVSDLKSDESNKQIFNIKIAKQNDSRDSEDKNESPDTDCLTASDKSKESSSVCSVCNEPIVGDAKFCSNCGNKLH